MCGDADQQTKQTCFTNPETQKGSQSRPTGWHFNEIGGLEQNKIMAQGWPGYLASELQFTDL